MSECRAGLMCVAIAISCAYVADYWGGLAILRVGLVGDLNCDGKVDFGDINPFIRLLGS